MKKVTLVAFLAAMFAVVWGEAYQVNTLSTKQLGMAHTGAGLKLGAESMHFNPGGLGFLDSKVDASAGLSIIIPKVQFWNKNGHDMPENDPSTPMYFYAAGNIKQLVSLGLSFTTPYGNSASWDKNWDGAELIQDISLKVFALQPTVAFNIFNVVSIGAGPTINFGNFSLSKALIGKGMFPYPYNDISVASVKLSGDADVAVGYNVGILYDAIPDKLAFGVAYRSKVKAKVSKGQAELDYAIPPQMQPALPMQVRILDKKAFEASLPLPANMNIGVSFRPTEKLLFDFDLQWVNWAAYDSLSVIFDLENMGKSTQTFPKGYENTFAYRLGTQIALAENFDLRAGVYFDQTPVPDDFLNPETPSTNKLGVTAGGSFRPIPALSINAAFLYAHGFNREGSCPAPIENIAPNRKFSGGYKVQAFVPSFGLSYKF